MPSKKLMCWINNLEHWNHRKIRRRRKKWGKKTLCIFRQIIFFERKSAFYLLLFHKEVDYECWWKKASHLNSSNENLRNATSKKKHTYTPNNNMDSILFGLIYLISSACFYAWTESIIDLMFVLCFLVMLCLSKFYYPFQV